MELKIKRLYPDAILPEYKTASSVGMDLYAHNVIREVRCSANEPPDGSFTFRNEIVGLVDLGECWHEATEIVVVGTGVAIELPPGYEAQVRPRSSLSKEGVMVQIGTIDTDYRGEIRVPITSIRKDGFWVDVGDRIAQLVISPVAHAELVEVEKLDDTERGAGGFGSTGR